MNFKPMPEEEIKKILEGAEDVLHARVRMGPRTCPFCDGAMQPTLSERGTLLIRCMVCSANIDPESGLITQLGSAYAGKEAVVNIVQPSSQSPDGQPPNRKRHKP